MTRHFYYTFRQSDYEITLSLCYQPICTEINIIKECMLLLMVDYLSRRWGACGGCATSEKFFIHWLWFATFKQPSNPFHVTQTLKPPQDRTPPTLLRKARLICSWEKTQTSWLLSRSHRSQARLSTAHTKRKCWDNWWYPGQRDKVSQMKPESRDRRWRHSHRPRTTLGRQESPPAAGQLPGCALFYPDWWRFRLYASPLPVGTNKH